MSSAFLAILLALPIVVLFILLHYYFVSRVLDGWYEREIKPQKDRIELLESKFNELIV